MTYLFTSTLLVRLLSEGPEADESLADFRCAVERAFDAVTRPDDRAALPRLTYDHQSPSGGPGSDLAVVVRQHQIVAVHDHDIRVVAAALREILSTFARDGGGIRHAKARQSSPNFSALSVGQRDASPGANSPRTQEFPPEEGFDLVARPPPPLLRRARAHRAAAG